MKNRFKVLLVMVGIFVVQISNNQSANASMEVKSIESKDRWTGLGLCVWPGKTCIKQTI